MLTTELFANVAGAPARADIVAALVAGEAEMAAAGLDTPLRMAHFLAQAAVHTRGFRRLEEILTLSAERIMVRWPDRFPTPADALPYERQPEMLAEVIYAGVYGNVDLSDGFRYRGSGMLPLTGRANLAAVGLENDPEAARTPAGALTAALRFWTQWEPNDLADSDDLPASARSSTTARPACANARCGSAG